MVAKENEELKKRMAGVEEMVANLIVDQQAMAKTFQERGDRHSRSLGRHRTEPEAARREIDRLQANQSTIVEECSVTNWHFSRSFHFYFIALTLVIIVPSLQVHYKLTPCYPFRLLTLFQTIKKIKSACIQSHNIANTMLKTTTDGPF